MEFDKFRRQFLKAGLAGLTGIVGGSLLKYVELRNFNSWKNGKKDGKNKRNGEYTIDDYVNAIIQIESSGNERAERYEVHLDDYSYGLGQLLTRTAKDLEARYSELPRLGNDIGEIRENLFNPEINKGYTRRLFEEEFDFYRDPYLAIAAYHAGHFAPRNARCQEQLNELYGTNLVRDGIFGEQSKDVLKRFQRDYELEIDGLFGEQSYRKLQEVWQEKNSGKENPIGIIPSNRYTPAHVEKFKRALERLKKPRLSRKLW